MDIELKTPPIVELNKLHKEGLFMAGFKGMKHYGNQIIDEVLKMKEEGKTNREISDYYGFKDKQVIKDLIKRYNRKQRKIASGIETKKKGRLKKVLTLQDQINQLKMENELLKSFLKECERWDVRN